MTLGPTWRASPSPPPTPWPDPLTHMQAGRKLEDGSHRGCEPTGGQAQARPPQEGTLGRRLEWDIRGTQLQSGASHPTPSLGQGGACNQQPSAQADPRWAGQKGDPCICPHQDSGPQEAPQGKAPLPWLPRTLPRASALCGGPGLPQGHCGLLSCGAHRHVHSRPGSPAVPPASSCPPALGPSADSGRPRPPAACLSPQATQGPAAPRTDARWPLWGQRCRCGSRQHGALSQTQEERAWRGPTLQHVLELPQCRLLGDLHTGVAGGAREASLGEAGENEAPEGALIATPTWAWVLGLTNFLSWPRHRFFEGP